MKDRLAAVVPEAGLAWLLGDTRQEWVGVPGRCACRGKAQEKGWAWGLSRLGEEKSVWATWSLLVTDTAQAP